MTADRNALPDGGPPCSTHPDAPHGFDLNGSHNAGRYRCDCEGWAPDDSLPDGANLERLRLERDLFAGMTGSAEAQTVKYTREMTWGGAASLLRALDAAVVAMANAGWRPIETAPLSGDMLVWGRCETLERWDHQNKCYIASPEVFNVYKEGDHGFTLNHNPHEDEYPSTHVKHVTHWMPLPAPPIAATGNGGSDG